MMSKSLFGEIKSVFRVLVLCGVVFNVSGCYNSGWEFLLEDLIMDVCPILASTTSKVKDLFIPQSSEPEECPIPPKLVSECIQCGRELSRVVTKRNNQLVRNGISLKDSTLSIRQFFSNMLSPEGTKAGKTSREMLTATKLLEMKLCSSSNVTPNTFMSFLDHQVIKVHDVTVCRPVSISCRREKYRTIDGSCNNEKHPTWGRAGASLTRIATPRYADGIYAMPLATSGRPLPNPRVLSTRLFSDQPIPSLVFTYLNMQFGQFVAHDLLLHVMDHTDEGPIQCCLGNGIDVLPSEWQNDKCIPLCVPEDDPFYSRYGIKCLNLVRTVTTPNDDCSLGRAEQMNTVTSFLDGSTIYGSNTILASKLRSRTGGRLREERKRHSKRGFLPTAEHISNACDLKNKSGPCYFSGDTRINQTPPLALLHTLFFREHNRVADILSSMNPTWGDEKLYQEARRIVIAEIQHITYQEWLPLNFGENYFRYYRISPSSLYSHDYNEEVNPGVINDFGAGAFRFLHSIIPDAMMTCPATYQAAYLHKISDHYADPGLLETTSSSFDDLVRGIISQSSAESDPFCTGEISNLLFKSTNKWGLDLISIDIQRGRDHGLASYNDYREICGLRKARTFQDLSGEIPQDRINALAQFYESVDDIDLFVGGSMERAVQGSILGHTFQCIVAEQFYRTRVGDRFFYDNSEMPHSFTTDQLKEIKKASMARIICDNTDVSHVQRKVFEMESSYNPKYSCEDYSAIPYVDLTPWKKHVDLFD